MVQHHSISLKGAASTLADVHNKVKKLSAKSIGTSPISPKMEYLTRMELPSSILTQVKIFLTLKKLKYCINSEHNNTHHFAEVTKRK